MARNVVVRNRTRRGRVEVQRDVVSITLSNTRTGRADPSANLLVTRELRLAQGIRTSVDIMAAATGPGEARRTVRRQREISSRLRITVIVRNDLHQREVRRDVVVGDRTVRCTAIDYRDR